MKKQLGHVLGNSFNDGANTITDDKALAGIKPAWVFSH